MQQKLTAGFLSINLYFAALKWPEHMRAVHTELSLADKVVVWLCPQDIDFAIIMWDALTEYLRGAFCPADWK